MSALSISQGDMEAVQRNVAKLRKQLALIAAAADDGAVEPGAILPHALLHNLHWCASKKDTCRQAPTCPKATLENITVSSD